MTDQKCANARIGKDLYAVDSQGVQVAVAYNGCPGCAFPGQKHFLNCGAYLSQLNAITRIKAQAQEDMKARDEKARMMAQAQQDREMADLRATLKADKRIAVVVAKTSWQCHLCLRVNAPHVDHCPCREAKDAIGQYWPQPPLVVPTPPTCEGPNIPGPKVGPVNWSYRYE